MGYPVVNAEPDVARLPAATTAPVAPAGTNGKALVVRFEPDARTYDGRFANNAWLQETPEPLSKLVWDNAAMLSKSDADALRVTTGDLLWLDAGSGRYLVAAAYILPGQPVGVVGLSLGYGRTRAGAVGNGLGFNAYAIRTAATAYTASVAARPAGETYELAST